MNRGLASRLLYSRCLKREQVLKESTKMDATTESDQSVDERRFARVPYAGGVEFVYGAGRDGSATAYDVGRGGLRVRMGRYLRPGTRLLVRLPESGQDDGPVELKAEVAWCRRELSALEFEVGLRIFYDAPDALDAISRVMYYALFEQGGLHRGAKMPAPAKRQRYDFAMQPLSTACGLTC
jgi:hypothetical protein